MIKVNLLRSQLNNPVQAPPRGFAAAAPTSFQRPEVRDALVKVGAISIFTIGLIVYENQTVNGLKGERTQIQARIAELEGVAKAKLTEVDAVKDVAKVARELQDKLKIMTLLSRLRLREVKTLDFMQSSIPEKVWMKSLDYEADKDDVQRGHLNFKGNSVGTDELTEFTRRLEDSAYLEQVITIHNQEVAVGQSKSVTMREFEFTALVEVKN